MEINTIRFLLQNGICIDLTYFTGVCSVKALIKAPDGRLVELYFHHALNLRLDHVVLDRVAAVGEEHLAEHVLEDLAGSLLYQLFFLLACQRRLVFHHFVSGLPGSYKE